MIHFTAILSFGP